MKQKTALIGFHDSDYLEFYRSAFGRRGYSADCVATIRDLMEHAHQKLYDVYLIDINLESPNSLCIEPAQNLYALVHDRVEKGDAKFCAISANRRTVLAAIQAGIPSKSKQIFRMDYFLPTQA